jgi:hypothetical protein
MKLIQISHLTKAITNEPQITFNLKGYIILNTSFVNTVCPMAIESKDEYYLHFYQDEQRLCVKMDTDAEEGLPVRFEGYPIIPRSHSYNIFCSAKATVQYFTGLFDWPLAEDKKHVIKYTVGEEQDHGLFELI